MTDSTTGDLERWETIAGFDGYEVSTFGNIRRRGGPYRKNGNVCLRLKRDVYGYPIMVFRKDGKHRPKTVHRLVLIAFGGPCPDGMECAHLDGDKENNHISNLRWVTSAENKRHMQLHGTVHRGEVHKKAKLTNRMVREMRRRRKAGETTTSLSSYFGIVPSAVSAICLRKNWRHLDQPAQQEDQHHD